MSYNLLNRFYQAILSNNEKEFSNIISKLKSSDFDRRNPFVDAADIGKVKLLEKLYEHFPELINTEDDRKMNPFQRAITNQNLDAAVFLFKKRQPHQSNYSEMSNQLLNKAIINNRLDVVEFVLNHADLNNISPGSITPLHHAVMVNSVPIIKLLISNRAIANKADQYGESPLHLAVRCGSTLAAKTLIEVIPTEYINQTDMNKDTALHKAILTENVSVIKYLLKKGADVTLKNNEQKSAVDMLSNITNPEVLRLFKSQKKPKLFSFIKKIFKKSPPASESGSTALKRNKTVIENDDMPDQKELKPVPYTRCKTRL